jgi:hypothetical protein
VGDYNVDLKEASETLSYKCNKHGLASLRWPNRVVGVFDSLCVVDVNDCVQLGVFIPDPVYVYNQIHAVVHRVGRGMPTPTIDVGHDFLRYVTSLCDFIFDPLDDCDVPSFAQWLDHSSYTGKRKTALAKLRASITDLDISDFKCKCFIKYECYDEPKQPRGIYSYTDESKVVVGPTVHAMDKKTFQGAKSARFFVKGSDPKGWPDRLARTFHERWVMETDFSSFESHQDGLLAEAVRVWARRMLCKLSDRRVAEIILAMMSAVNVMEFKCLTAKVIQRLMSGAMWTSSSNSVLNLFIVSYLILRSKFPLADPGFLVEMFKTNFEGIFEGDDGLTVWSPVSDQLIDDLGIVLKFKVKPTWCDAEFCGITCAKNSRVIVTDPISVVRKFFCLPIRYATSQKKRRELLRAKAMSYKYLYNDVPIIGELCHKVCELTKSLNVRKGIVIGTGWRSFVEEGRGLVCVPPRSREMPIDDPVRLCIRDHFGIQPGEQLQIEDDIRRSKGPNIEIDLSRFLDGNDMTHRKYVVDDFDHRMMSGQSESALELGSMPVLKFAIKAFEETCKRIDMNVGVDKSAHEYLRLQGIDPPPLRSNL